MGFTILINIAYSQNINHDADEDKITIILDKCIMAKPYPHVSIADIDTATELKITNFIVFLYPVYYC